MSTTVFEAIGTRWQIDTPDAMPPDALTAVHERIDIFDKTYSRFRADSLVTKMARESGSFVLPADAASLLAIYRQLYDLTSGAVTPLVGQLLADAGYDHQYSFKERPLTPPPAWDDVLTYQPPKLILWQPALLDFGAAGKGYLVDIVAEVLAGHGLSEFTIDAGGDILRHDPAGRPLRIGLEHPADPSLAIGVAELSNASICGSAGNRRAWGRFHHIIDPHRLASPQTVRAVWVAAPTALVADALATALFFVSAATLAPHFAFEYCLIREDYSAETSTGFPGEIFTE